MKLQSVCLLLVSSLLLCLGCQSTRPTVKIEIQGQIEEKKPEYTISISL